MGALAGGGRWRGLAACGSLLALFGVPREFVACPARPSPASARDAAAVSGVVKVLGSLCPRGGGRAGERKGEACLWGEEKASDEKTHQVRERLLAPLLRHDGRL